MPLGQLVRMARYSDLKDLKGKKICTYCSDGYRGNMAADELSKQASKQGFDAISIEGGYCAWKDSRKKEKKENSSSINE